MMLSINMISIILLHHIMECEAIYIHSKENADESKFDFIFMYKQPLYRDLQNGYDILQTNHFCKNPTL
jgi:hypothetical protein